jgi:MFS family permease
MADRVLSDKRRISNPFFSLRNRNFRYYLIGSGVSQTGTWIQNVAQPWLAYTLTKSPLLLGIIGALQVAPVLFLSLFIGPVIDKLDKKKILIFTQVASMLLTLIFSILVFTGIVRYWHIVLLSLFLGIINTLDFPTRQAFINQLLADKTELKNAISLNSALLSITRIIGPALAGIIMEFLSIGVCFLINSLSFGMIALSLLFIRPIKISKVKLTHNNFTEIINGVKYVLKNKIIISTLLILTIVMTFGNNLTILVPVLAKEVLQKQETGYGVLMSLMGAGSFFGGMFMAGISKKNLAKVLLYVFPLVIGSLLIAIGFSNLYLTAGLGLALLGFFFISFTAKVASILQTNTKNEFMGRVMSIFSMLATGSALIGNLYAGWVTDRFGAKIGFIGCGLMIVMLMVPTYLATKSVYATKDSQEDC